jgi:dTDP-4-dehydrorhamnose 3,5-epimerase
MGPHGMATRFITTDIPGVLIVQPDVHPDARGFFSEVYRQQEYTRHGVAASFVQDNHSHSRRGVLRGLHFQFQQAQDKLVYAARGEIFDVVVDVRRGSPAFGKWFGHVLSDQNHQQLYIPRGLAHGFCVLSETADVIYKCSDYYAPAGELGVLWSDPDLGIQWPIAGPLVSAKDGQSARLRDIPEDRLPRYAPGP